LGCRDLIDPYRQWALHRCGFPEIWLTLDTGPDPGEIAVIDRGWKGLSHRELAGRITRKPAPSASSRAAHAAAVTAVIAARRDDYDGDADGKMDGCCSARVRVYSAWDADERFDLEAVRAALLEAADMKLPVVNLSLSISLPNQRDLDDAIAALHQLLALAPEDVQGLYALAKQLTAIGEYGQAALQVLADIMNDKAVAASTRVSAAKAILERGFGKPAANAKEPAPLRNSRRDRSRSAGS